jgi:hypothetical protein
MLVDGAIIPKGALAEEGSPRTLTCAVVIPSKSSIVGVMVSGVKVSVIRGNETEGMVAVMKNGDGTAGLDVEIFKVQLEMIRTTAGK